MVCLSEWNEGKAKIAGISHWWHGCSVIKRDHYQDDQITKHVLGLFAIFTLFDVISSKATSSYVATSSEIELKVKRTIIATSTLFSRSQTLLLLRFLKSSASKLFKRMFLRIQLVLLSALFALGQVDLYIGRVTSLERLCGDEKVDLQQRCCIGRRSVWQVCCRHDARLRYCHAVFLHSEQTSVFNLRVGFVRLKSGNRKTNDAFIKTFRRWSEHAGANQRLIPMVIPMDRDSRLFDSLGLESYPTLVYLHAWHDLIEVTLFSRCYL